MASSLQLATIALSLIYYVTTAQNDTNITTTEMGTTDMGSTMYYSTTMMSTDEPTTADPTTAEPTTPRPTPYPTTANPTTDSPTRTLEPSMEPTPGPVSMPSGTPTDAPNILSGDDDDIKDGIVAFLQVVITAIRSDVPGAITCIKVLAREGFFLGAFDGVACEGASSDQCQTAIGECVDILSSDDPESDTRRRLEEESDIIGVDLEYKVVISDPEVVTAYNQRIDSGSFEAEFTETLQDEYEGVRVEEIEFQEATVGDPDEFLGKEDPTFGEIIASPYILLGIVCTIVGIVWLLFLRSSIENKYPSYLSQPASAPSQGGNAIEMAQR